jgi:hypothetical protein
LLAAPAAYNFRSKRVVAVVGFVQHRIYNEKKQLGFLISHPHACLQILEVQSFITRGPSNKKDLIRRKHLG